MSSVEWDGAGYFQGAVDFSVVPLFRNASSGHVPDASRGVLCMVPQHLPRLLYTANNVELYGLIFTQTWTDVARVTLGKYN